MKSGYLEPLNLIAGIAWMRAGGELHEYFTSHPFAPMFPWHDGWRDKKYDEQRMMKLELAVQCLKSRDNEIKLAKHDMINWLACTYYKQYGDKNIIRKRGGVILDQICRFGCLGHFRLPQENFHKIMGQYFFWFHLNKSTIIICVRKRLKKKDQKKNVKKN